MKDYSYYSKWMSSDLLRIMKKAHLFVELMMTLTVLTWRFSGCVLNADGEWWRGEERSPRVTARLLRTPVLRQTCRNQETHKVFWVSDSKLYSSSHQANICCFNMKSTLNLLRAFLKATLLLLMVCLHWPDRDRNRSKMGLFWLCRGDYCTETGDNTDSHWFLFTCYRSRSGFDLGPVSVNTP